VLELATDLGLLDEPPEQIGLARVPFEQDLDGEVAAEIDVATAQDGSHAAPGDLAVELVLVGALGVIGHLG
jgi:hypothetical protein